MSLQGIGKVELLVPVYYPDMWPLFAATSRPVGHHGFNCKLHKAGTSFLPLSKSITETEICRDFDF